MKWSVIFFFKWSRRWLLRGIYFSEKNIPTIIMNPSGGNAHSQNEYVNIDSLKKLYEIY